MVEQQVQISLFHWQLNCFDSLNGNFHRHSQNIRFHLSCHQFFSKLIKPTKPRENKTDQKSFVSHSRLKMNFTIKRTNDKQAKTMPEIKIPLNDDLEIQPSPTQGNSSALKMKTKSSSLDIIFHWENSLRLQFSAASIESEEKKCYLMRKSSIGKRFSHSEIKQRIKQRRKCVEKTS